MNPQEGYEHLNTPWMNMKVGDLVSIVWTEGCETPAIVGVITGVGPYEPLEYRDPFSIADPHKRQLEHMARQKIEILESGRYHWCERGDLRVIA
tara:strand:- start:845 stop:1126 length:282 start_codon:yes stop_codon:yes gene_type:complete